MTNTERSDIIKNQEIYGLQNLIRPEGDALMKQTFERLTLEDIAKEINISRTTIYKVINQKGNVSETTRNTVMEALKKYNYVPNNNARNLAMNRHYAVAYIGFDSRDAAYFSPTIQEGIRQAVLDYGDHGLTVDSYLSSVEQPEQQVEDVRQAYDSGIRHFIIACTDADQMKLTLTWLRDSGCTVILLSKYVGPEYCDSFIGTDDYRSGQLAAEVLGHMIPSDGSLQILIARASHSNMFSTRKKLEGFLNYMQERRPAVRILPLLEDMEDDARIQEALSQALSSRKPDGIYDLTYRLDVISRTLQKMGLQETALTGMDLFPEIVPCIRDHTIDAIVFQNLKAQAYLACRLLFEQMCYGNEIPRRNYHSKLEIVMSGNLDYFLEKSPEPTF